jgi:TPR repeat protein
VICSMCPNRLLSGNDILEAKAWAARRPKTAPEPTALQLDFIRASEEEAEARLSAQRKQLDAMAAAQAEREKALHDAEEALKQAADALRRRAKIRNIALVIVSILAVLAGWLGWSAEQARITAEEQRKLAEQQRITAEEQRTRAEQQKKTAEEQRQQADELLARGTNIIVNLRKGMDSETKHEAFALFQAGAIHGDATSMYDLGLFYQNGYGVPRDYANAREWYEKAAAKDSVEAMANLGALFVNGLGVPQDYTKAREWYEKAADKGDASARWLWSDCQCARKQWQDGMMKHCALRRRSRRNSRRRRRNVTAGPASRRRVNSSK